MTRSAYGYTIFCDDIRQEVGGKISFMGTYRGVMYVSPAFPLTLPRFALAINFCQPGSAPSNPITVQVYLPGDPDEKPTFETEIPLEKIRDAEPPPDLESRMFSAAIYDPFAPLTLREAGLIRVRALYGDKTVKLGALKVELVPEE